MGIKNRITTPRLLLRRWKIRDKHDLFEYAQLDDVGPMAGWPPHASVGESAQIIRKALSTRGNYAITLRDSGKVIGSIGMHSTALSQSNPSINSLEMGYVLNPKYWGNEYIPEAALHYIRYAFLDFGLDAVLSACFDFNERSQRVINKLGFEFIYEKETVIEQLNSFKATERVHILPAQRFWQLYAQREYDKFF